MKLIFIGSGTGENPWLEETGKLCHRPDFSVEIFQATSEDLDLQEGLFQSLLFHCDDCSLLILNSHAGTTYFKKFDRLLKIIREKSINTFIECTIPEEMQDFRPLFKGSNEDYQYIHSSLVYGGRENTQALILQVMKMTGGHDIQIPPLVRPPTEGCYHPELPEDTTFKTHINRLNPDKPTIGIIFHQSTFIRNNLLVIDALIHAIESKGMNSLAIFLNTAPDPFSGSLGIKKIVESYLIKERKPIIDCLIINMGFSQISLSDPNDGSRKEFPRNFFQDLHVPLIQAHTMFRSFDAWNKDIQGLSTMEISSNIVWPEFDGQIISIPLGSSEKDEKGTTIAIPIPGRPERVADMAQQISRLRRTPVSERRVAILIYQYTGETDTLGHATGLDVPASVIEMLRYLQTAGYHVDHIPEDGNALIKKMIDGLTNDIRYLSKQQVKERSAGLITKEEYNQWFSQIPQKNQGKISVDWGAPPGELFENDGNLCIPGIINGNIFIGIQPPRGYFEQAESLIHSHDLVMPHHYLAYYRWIKHSFGAHAVVHVGTHGTLEWLPGKGTAMSEECYPDLIFEDMPHLYPYIINDPGEAVQAKRRSWSVILDHLIPVMMRAEGYGELSDLDSILQEYFRAKTVGENSKTIALLKEIHTIIIGKNFTSDLGLPDTLTPEDIAPHAERIYDYICELRDTIIRDGLHVFGAPPPEKRFEEMIYALTRLSNGNVPSLRAAIAQEYSLVLQELLDKPSEYDPANNMTNGMLLDMVDSTCQNLIRRMAETGYSYDQTQEIISKEFPDLSSEILPSLEFICKSVAPGLLGTTDELHYFGLGLDGDYVLPGPSGDPTRGNAHLLPTGKNLYSIDPATIPTPSAWKTGKDLANQMIERYISEKGKYPERVGIVVWATDTMRTGGDDIAYILHLIGLRPIWSDRGGAVTGLEVIPLSELGRPRIDVTLRITGLFRDAFPNLVDMLDRGIELVATLDEAEDNNYLASHLKQDLLQRIIEGIPEETAREISLIRIFGDPPGNYGAGVSDVVHASAWKEQKDLADTYTTWGAHAYGRKFKGETFSGLFKEQFSKLDATVKNLPSREYDVLDTDDEYMFLGGMNACVKSYGNKNPVSVTGDASDPDNVKTRRLEEEIRFTVRSRVLNPAWFEGLKPHGFRGAQEIVTSVEYMFGWDATSDVVDDWEYQSVAEHFLFNEENRKWIEDNNPYAIHSISGRLLEANQRGMWETDTKTIQKLQQLFLKAEEYYEGTG
ncbi:cobaltochelatase subunit CobN [Methanospirillum stamsii]|uniref:Cobaltochelatase subunit CobN n=1 Tax=Methanospirillum stamsii TaxID=1277351 RepID=A0A2V2NJP2_9EURY|nr:cobaltochelatase subunit CobN [Methanospirillum stamsii]PWR75831.1 cobaltochelatase subunit CobN [Methanospirillum stamsii]